MDRVPAPRWKALLAALERWGLLLAQDARLPSVASTIAGEVVSGSWWSHPSGGAIFDALRRLEQGGTFSARLLDGKWVYVHARLVPPVQAMACSGEGWQTDGLAPDAARLLARLRKGEEVRTDAAGDVASRRRLAAAATVLETRLLARSREVHTEGGHHARSVAAWEVPAGTELPPADAARAALDAAIARLVETYGGTATPPWRPRGSRRSRPARS
jgi:hypothetical protein